MKNSEINKIKRERAEKNNDKFWHKRIGKCDPQRCASACCRYSVVKINTNYEYHLFTNHSRQNNLFAIKKLKNSELVINNHVCTNMTMNGKCKLHDKKAQPYTCDVFPMHHTDGVYLAVKKYCSYKFIKIKNLKYKKKTKSKSEKVEAK